MAPVHGINLFYFCRIALHFSPHLSLSFSLGFGNSIFPLLLGDNGFAALLIADASLYLIPLILSSSLQVVPLSDIYNENIQVQLLSYLYLKSHTLFSLTVALMEREEGEKAFILNQ